MDLFTSHRSILKAFFRDVSLAVPVVSVLKKTETHFMCFCFFGWAGAIRTRGMTESKSVALPLGYSPILENTRQGYSPFASYSFCMGWIERFELSASRATIWRANQLRYTHHIGAPKGTRTPGLLLRRQLLYPAELLAQLLDAWNLTLATYLILSRRSLVPHLPSILHLERVMGIYPWPEKPAPGSLFPALPAAFSIPCL